MAETAPLIITLAIDQPSQDYFTQLRDQYFPRHCNYLEAHITLFHHLPSDLTMISDVLQTLAKRAIMELQVSGVKNIGNGVAYSIVSSELQQLHAALQKSFAPYLITQDRTVLRPHITVQNKVTAFKAKQTYEALLENFEPFSIQGLGFSTWLYLKGPWQLVQHYLFQTGKGAL